jgi:hypothetical protein
MRLDYAKGASSKKSVYPHQLEENADIILAAASSAATPLY